MSDSESRSPAPAKKADSDEDSEPTIDKDIVVTKYNMAADIVNAVLKELVARAVPDAVVGQLCDYGDTQVLERTGKVYKKEKDVRKGIAFPTCISINHCICHYSPLRSEGDEVRLKQGDMIKIDLGAHVDGFIATVAHTMVVGADKDHKVTGKRADAIWAAYNSSEVALRMLQPGKHKNMEVSDTIQRVAESYKCKPIENMLSHQLRRNKIDGEKQIIQNPGEKQRSDLKKCEFKKHEVYAIDVLVSTGEGKAREMDQRTTVYKKADDIIYSLKMKASRQFHSEADKRFGNMPFSLRSFGGGDNTSSGGDGVNETHARMGVVECERHGLYKPYPVLYERDGEFVAQFKCTALLMPSGIHKITGIAPDPDVYVTEHKVTDEKLSALLSASLKPSKKAKAKKKKAANPGGKENAQLA